MGKQKFEYKNRKNRLENHRDCNCAKKLCKAHFEDHKNCCSFTTQSILEDNNSKTTKSQMCMHFLKINQGITEKMQFLVSEVNTISSKILEIVNSKKEKFVDISIFTEKVKKSIGELKVSVCHSDISFLVFDEFCKGIFNPPKEISNISPTCGFYNRDLAKLLSRHFEGYLKVEANDQMEERQKRKEDFKKLLGKLDVIETLTGKLESLITGEKSSKSVLIEVYSEQEAKILRQRNQLNERKLDIFNKQKEVDTLVEIIKEKEEIINKKDKELAEKNEINNQNNKIIAEKDELLNTLSREITEKDLLANEYKAKIAENTQVINQQNERIVEQTEMLKESKETLIESDKSVKILTTSKNILESTLKKYQDYIMSLEQEFNCTIQHLGQKLEGYIKNLHKIPDTLPQTSDSPSTPRNSRPSLREFISQGLENLGNTCFMNSTLQNIAHFDAFEDFFTNLTPTSPLTSTLKTLIIQQRSSNSISNALHSFKSQSVKFGGYGDGTQQDSKEFYSFLIEHLQEQAGTSLDQFLFQRLDTYSFANSCRHSNIVTTPSPFIFLQGGRDVGIEIAEYFAEEDESKDLWCMDCQGMKRGRITTSFRYPVVLVAYFHQPRTVELGARVRLRRESAGNRTKESVKEYRIESAVVRSGRTPQSGHYWAATLEGEKCVIYNDSSVGTTKEKTVLAYMIFLQLL